MQRWKKKLENLPKKRTYCTVWWAQSLPDVLLGRDKGGFICHSMLRWWKCEGLRRLWSLVDRRCLKLHFAPVLVLCCLTFLLVLGTPLLTLQQSLGFSLSNRLLF